MKEIKIRDSKRARATIEASEKGYYVDEEGNVISPKGRKRKPQSQWSRGSVYYRFTVRGNDGKNTTVQYHQLAAYQKFGRAALVKGIQIRHLDNNSENNRPDNLALGTAGDNAMDNPEDERLARAKHAASHRKKLNDIEVARLRKEHAEGARQKDLCKKYGIAKSTCSYIVNRKTYA
jgi:hypothetical protein